jgi:hypothetical protein
MLRVLVLMAIVTGRVVRITCSTATSILVTNGAAEDREPGGVWVAGFATTTTSELDVSGETVRLLRAELRRLSPASVVEGDQRSFLRRRATSNRYDREIAVPNRIILLVSASNVPHIAPTLPTFGLNSFSCRSVRYPSECRS